ncbi:hypothetical protein G6692_03705 [Polynucleobacter paneuropaeus]|nr:hypothetical protein [Polynucleobacter paneuropaeus]
MKRKLSDITKEEIERNSQVNLSVTDMNLYRKLMKPINGIYFLINKKYQIFYIGEADDVFIRLASHPERDSIYKVAIFLTPGFCQSERKYVEGTFFHIFKSVNIRFGKVPIPVRKMLQLLDLGAIDVRLPDAFFSWSTYINDFVSKLPKDRNNTPLSRITSSATFKPVIGVKVSLSVLRALFPDELALKI